MSKLPYMEPEYAYKDPEDSSRKDENQEYYSVRESKKQREEYMQSEPQKEEAAPEVEQPKKKAVDLIPEERLQELLNILLPWGYSHYDAHKYTGVSPYIGSARNIITIVANDTEGWDSVFVIIMDRFTEEDEDEVNSLGFYKGIMKVIAPELYSDNERFADEFNVIRFGWADDDVWNNRFPAKI